MSDTDNLLDKVEAAAREHLPEAVGNALRERLRQADDERAQLKKAREKINELEQDVVKSCKALSELRERESSIKQREQRLETEEKSVTAREHAVKLREQLIDLREGHADEKVGLIRGIVKDVFSNNRFKYERTRNGEVVVPGQDHIPPHNTQDGAWHQGQYGQAPHVAPTTETETVEGEGDVPPAAQ